jgi:hypothetical protein
MFKVTNSSPNKLYESRLMRFRANEKIEMEIVTKYFLKKFMKSKL